MILKDYRPSQTFLTGLNVRVTQLIGPDMDTQVEQRAAHMAILLLFSLTTMDVILEEAGTREGATRIPTTCTEAK